MSGQNLPRPKGRWHPQFFSHALAVVQESHKRSHLNQPLHRDNSPRMKKPSTRKIVQTGEQHAVWKALDLVSSSLFSREIKRAVLPERFTAPRFKAYNGRTDPVAHISHYQKRMDLCRYNDSLMCRLFPSSLGEIALRWFNQLGKRTIASWIQMAEAFVTRFITNCRRTKKMDALLTLKLEDGESIKDYATRFWETYNDIDNCSENVAVRTFKSGLPLETRLRQSLTKRPATTLRKLMDRIEQFIKVEEDGGNTASKQTVT
uniref:Retrotransposon gag domain-containing protein n=1 Tax=Fagus sylvatica TaxID=28930 RepID=A0A2N9IZ10_FAGSY